MLNPKKILHDFPLLETYHELCYLDNAATTQKPRRVLQALSQFYSEDNANVHRGVSWLSARATEAYEKSREHVARFIGAASEKEIVFVRGTTEGINLVARTLTEQFSSGDEILLTEMEHHSNIIPWQLAAERNGLKIKVVPVTDRGELDFECLESMLTERVRIVAIVHTSNTLGTINPISRVCKLAHEKGALVLVDGAQAVLHQPINVETLGCDFFVFSGHKVLGPTGIGVLYGKVKHLESLAPFQGGGEMITDVAFSGSSFREPPHRFEAGTPHIAGAIGLSEALTYLETFSWDHIIKHEQKMLKLAREALRELPGVQLIGDAAESSAIVSFIIEGVHPHDIGSVLDAHNVVVRTGHHCTQPLMKRFGVPATVRASFTIYNSEQDIERLVKGIRVAQEILL